METTLVSIIIPNYNRESLVGETLDSILSQIYKNWECIIVDDGSTDNSCNIIEQYLIKDSRFKLIKRPHNYPKGANACRNLGMKNINGNYIIFFDSDDLMTPHHIEEKVKYMTSGDYDFVITKTEYFNNPENHHPINYRGLFELPITADHFIQKKINWLTLDPIIKTTVASSISFTEKNRSAEEYNYFVKLLLTSEKAVAKDIVLSLRRFHPESYQSNLKTQDDIYHNSFFYFYDTFLETKKMKVSESSQRFLLSQASEILCKQKKLLSPHEKKQFYNHLITTFGIFKGLNKIRILLS
ncbi:MAG: hypothetical protein K0R77_1317 [Chryseobacterium sp.]|jgi:glycosyltransferase involved in cell wall biosynthesis|uniref:glycosyltransferase family 2 protein n=1 Tax=Chryseobacterium sp. TaxID=1871047 RepID=UPI002622FEE8|nr:glycosyltransferase family 2 protein [Chryseobacterium sp.]MDF2552042.1 hypothetical protein [Chryseobacterium sp.]